MACDTLAMALDAEARSSRGCFTAFKSSEVWDAAKELK